MVLMLRKYLLFLTKNQSFQDFDLQPKQEKQAIVQLEIKKGNYTKIRFNS